MTFHPTKQALVDTAIELLNQEPPIEVTIDEVLERSNISRGSLYHHFEDFDELLECAHIARYSAYVDLSIAALTQVLKGAHSRDELVRDVRKVTNQTQSPDAKENRLKRVQTLGFAASSARMARALSKEQDRLTSTIADLYREVVEKGWGNEDFSPDIVAVFIQAYTLGKVVDDFAAIPMDPKGWSKLIDLILETLIFPTN